MDPYSISEENHSDLGNIFFEIINWNEFRKFNAKKSFVEFTGCSKQALRSMSVGRLKDLQWAYYNLMRREKKTSCYPHDILLASPSSPVSNRSSCSL